MQLQDHLPVTSHTGIVHGDYKLDNVMFAEGDCSRVVALLDWEMSTLGDTMADLGFLLSLWDQPVEVFHPLTEGVTAFPGFASRNELIEMYARESGREPADLEWYQALADVKLAIILEQIHARHAQGFAEGDQFTGVGDMVDPLLTRAADTLA